MLCSVTIPTHAGSGHLTATAPCKDREERRGDQERPHLAEGVLHLIKVRSFVEVAGQQFGQQGLGNICHAAQDEADEDLHDGGPGYLHILLPLLAVSKGHQEQQQRQAGSQEAGHGFLQDPHCQLVAAAVWVTTRDAFCQAKVMSLGHIFHGISDQEADPWATAHLINSDEEPLQKHFELSLLARDIKWLW